MFVGIGLPITIGGGGGNAPLTGATLDMNFARSAYFGATPANLTVTRAGTNATDLTYDQTGRTSYNSFSANTARIVADGRGLLVEESRTQYLGVTDTPATQTTSSLGTGSYTLWVIGAGSAAVSAGTATITGAGSATAGTPLTFTVTVGGTVVVTKTGALTFFQLENGASATSYIPNAGAAGSTSVRAADAVSLASTAFSSWFTSSATVTLYAEFRQNVASTVSQSAIDICDGTTNNRAVIRAQAANGLAQIVVRSGAASQFSQQSVGSTGTSTRKEALTYQASDFAMSTFGEAAITQASGSVPTGMNLLVIGAATGATEYLNGFVRRIAYLPSRASNAAIVSLAS